MSQASNQESRDSNSGSWLLSPHSWQLYYMSIYKVRRGPAMGQAVLPGPREKAVPWPPAQQPPLEGQLGQSGLGPNHHQPREPRHSPSKWEGLHTQQLGKHLNLTAASTHRALDNAPGPVLSALQILCHLILGSAYSPESSIMPICPLPLQDLPG